MLKGMLLPHQLGRPREGLQGWPEELCAGRMLRERSCDREFERNKPGAYQLKYYAPGVGDVRVGWRGPEEEEKEGLELVKDVRLSPHKSRPSPARTRSNWRKTPTSSRITTVRRSQRGPHFERGLFVRPLVARIGAFLRERC